MNNIQKQIDKSVEEFQKRWNTCQWSEKDGFHPEAFKYSPAEEGEEVEYNSDKIKQFIKQSQLDLIEVIKGEIEKLPSFETEDFIFSTAIKRQDVLDLLNNLK